MAGKPYRGRSMVEEKEDSQTLSLGQLLGQVCRHVRHRRQKKMESIGLYHAQAQILSRLWQEDGISQVVLARDLHISPPTATGTLKRMERDGWVHRIRDESDQRIVRVYLTDQARMFREEARATFRELEREIASMLSDREIETFKQSLLIVNRYLSEVNAGHDNAEVDIMKKGEGSS